MLSRNPNCFEKKGRLLLDLNEFVPNRLCYELSSTAVTQQLLFKNLVNFICKLDGNRALELCDLDVVAICVEDERSFLVLVGGENEC